MKTLCLLILFVLVAVALSAPAASPDNTPTVSVLRYKKKHLENIQRAIIAQYERIGGTTIVHQPLTANIVNPAVQGFNT
ncbi:LOW QUALITY PROTEIN: uncharacterized protein Dere_GG27239 [Drosophila erecta]|nr:LOW QUALITY PROTEIN: uncharacterized protein Dere_GG27239 [Drosophila erecta]